MSKNRTELNKNLAQMLRVGRLIMFRECLKNHIIPFILDDDHKQFYYRGLKEFENVRGYLIDTCLSEQDVYTEWVRYFYGDLLNKKNGCQ